MANNDSDKKNKFTHLNSAGEANMVDVSDKGETSRMAVAQSRVVLSELILVQLRSQAVAKGDVLATARIAGIQAAKKCSDLIPLCHPLPLSKVAIEIKEYLDGDKEGLEIICCCKSTGRTGVEMEALTAASIAALTVYDMCKAIDKGIVIESVQLLEKQGGKSGHWVRT